MTKTVRDFVAFPLIVVLILATLFLAVDQYCVSDVQRRSPNYPGAERLEARTNGLRATGIGNSLEIFLSSDSQETIENWYEELAIQAQKQGRTRGVASLSFWLEPNPEGEGTLIYRLSQCVL